MNMNKQKVDQRDDEWHGHKELELNYGKVTCIQVNY